jgi:hypothetical protein
MIPLSCVGLVGEDVQGAVGRGERQRYRPGRNVSLSRLPTHRELEERTHVPVGYTCTRV